MRNCCLALAFASWVFDAAANPVPNPAPLRLPDFPSGGDGNNNGEGNNNFGDRNRDDRVVVVANEQEVTLRLSVGDHKTLDVVQPFEVDEARIKYAPPGVGCFFISNSFDQSLPASSFSKSPSKTFEVQGSPNEETMRLNFVSPTFYSSGSAMEGENLVLDPPFSNVKYLTCFRVGQQYFTGNQVLLLLEQEPLQGLAMFDSDGNKLKRRTRFMSWALEPTTSDVEQAVRSITWPNEKVKTVRAAIVHAPPALASSVTCRLFRKAVGSLERQTVRFADISIARPLTKTIPDYGATLCRKTQDFDMSMFERLELREL